MNSLYGNGSAYDAMNDSLVADKQFYIEEFKNLTGGILELACGTGRITCALAQAGQTVTGLDLSESMLNEARQKSRNLNLDIGWHLGSMTNFNLNQKFEIIFVAYNSVHHILTNEEFKNFLKCVKNHLKPNGRLLFDIFNPSMALLAKNRTRSEVTHFIEPVTGETIFVTEDNCYDSATQINHVTYYYSKKDQPDFFSHPLDMRCYFPLEIDALLGFNGFKIVNKHGSFVKESFSSRSIKQIFDCAIVEACVTI